MAHLAAVVCAGLSLWAVPAAAQEAASGTVSTIYGMLKKSVHGSPAFKRFARDLNWPANETGCARSPAEARALQLGSVTVNQRPGSIEPAVTQTYEEYKKRGRSPSIKVDAPCTVEISTVCWFGALLAAPGSAEAWDFASGRIAFAYMIRALTKRFDVPATVTERFALRMEELARLSIADTTAGRGETEDDLLRQSNEAERSLALAWNAYLQANGKTGSVPSLSYEAGCGASMLTVGFQTEPKGGSVRVISMLDWLVCKAVGRDPWDKGCWGWEDIVTDAIGMLGVYNYEVKWPDGSMRRGPVDIREKMGKNTITVRIGRAGPPAQTALSE